MSLQRRTHWIVGMKRSIWQEQLFTFNKSCRINERCCRGFPWSRFLLRLNTSHTAAAACSSDLFIQMKTERRSVINTDNELSVDLLHHVTTKTTAPQHWQLWFWTLSRESTKLSQVQVMSHRWNTWGRGYCWRSDLEFHPGIPGMTERFSLFLLLSTDFSSFSTFNDKSVFL